MRTSPTGVVLQPGQSNIAIEYTGLSLIKSEQIKFKYKLEGLEADWVEAGTRRTVDYSYLPVGSYTFRVIAANADGVWNNEGAVLTIGQGFDLDRANAGLGLVGLRERAQLLKGEISIESDPGGGTKIFLRLGG